MRLATLGTCLSNLSALMMSQDFGYQWLNNTLVTNSGLFLSRVIKGDQPISPDQFRELLGLDADNQAHEGSLRNQYREYAGLCAMDRSLPGLWENLYNRQFDVILMDNLGDTAMFNHVYKGDQFEPFEFSTPLDFGSNCQALSEVVQIVPRLSCDQSAENWTRITHYLLALQPQARLFFTCAHYCTSIGDRERYDLALGFHAAFVERAGDLPIEIIPPLALPPHLTKLPDDRDHYDWSVYKALAGHFHIATVAGWRDWTNKRLPDEVRLAVVDHNAVSAVQKVMTYSPLSLREVVAEALGLPPERIDEAAGMDVTETWDSLKHVGVLISVEKAFGGIAFKAVTDIHNVALVRKALAQINIIAADDPSLLPPMPNATDAMQCEGMPEDLTTQSHLFGGFALRATAEPGSPFALFIANGVERVLTRGWILDCAGYVAEHLGDLEKGAVVAIVLDHSPHLYTSFIGCVMAGLVPTILAPMNSRQDAEVFRDSMATLFYRIQPAAVISSDQTAASVPVTTARRLRAESIVPSSAGAQTLMRQVATFDQPDATAFLQHSSGTTGHKKGVALTHRQVMEQSRVYSDAIGMTSSDSVISWLPLYHDMGLLTSFIIPAILGVRIISLSNFEWVVRPTLLLDYIDREKAQFCWLPNFAFLHIVRNDDGSRSWNLDSMRMFVNCSEACRAAAFDAFEARYGVMGAGREKLQVSYAMAENVFAVTQTREARVRANVQGYLSCGRTLPGMEIEIRDESGVVQPEGEVGELFIRSNCLFSGYFALPEVTAERLREGWYRTGDIGYFIDGDLFVIGRVDDLIIVNGRNIIAHEVESDLAKVSGLAPGRALVAGEFDDVVGSYRLLVLAEKDDDDTDTGQIEKNIRATVLATCGVAPTQIEILPRGFLIKSTSGKLSRQKSIEKYFSAREVSESRPL